MENNLGMRIRNKRIEKKMTQEKFGEIVGVSKWTVINWESGKRIPLATYLPKISSMLDVSINYLLGEEDICAGSYAARIVYDDTDGKNTSVPVVVRTFGDLEKLCNTSSMKELYKTARDDDVLLIKEYILNSRIDADKLPFAVIAEDSCPEWGIARNARVVINPAENVMNMDVALIRYYSKFAFRKVRFLPDTVIYLISGDGRSINITAEENSAGVFQIYGKAVLALSNIIHGI